MEVHRFKTDLYICVPSTIHVNTFCCTFTDVHVHGLFIIVNTLYTF